MPQRLRLPDSEIAHAYQSGDFTQRELAKMHGVSKPVIARVLREHGVSAVRPAHKRPIYSCDRGFFDVIDTEAKAYWLGFLAADGCVTDRGKKGLSVTLCLAERDADHVERFRRAIGASNPIDRYQQINWGMTSSFARITIHGPDLPRGLIAHGVHPRKTFTHAWPTLTGETLRHYLRGYVDGDGHFGIGRFEVAGTISFLEVFRDYLEGLCVSRGTVSRPNGSGGIAVLMYGGNRQVERIHTHFYANAAIALPRKAEVTQPQPVERWADRHDSCIACGTTDQPHNAGGLCKRCYGIQWRKDHA